MFSTAGKPPAPPSPPSFLASLSSRRRGCSTS
jgi:hypothetical protein